MDTRYGPVLNSIRGIWRVSDSLFGVPKFEGDDPVAGSSSSATSINVGASEPPTVLEEVGQGFRYIGLQARRRFLNFKKKIGLQTGHVDSAEHEPPRDAEAPRPQASPTATDTSDCTREEDDWMNVFSDTESDTTYEPKRFRPCRPPGPIMQTINSTIDRAASAHHSIRRSAGASSSAVGCAIYNGVGQPIQYVRSRSNTSDDQLADEHAWMSTKLPPDSPHKKINLEPTHIKDVEDFSLGNQAPLKLGVNPVAAGLSSGTAEKRIEKQKAKNTANTLGPNLNSPVSQGLRKECAREDIRHPRDAPEGCNLDCLPVMGEKFEDLPRKGYFTEYAEASTKELLTRKSKVMRAMSREKTNEAARQIGRNGDHTDPTDALEAQFRPTLGPRCHSDVGSAHTRNYQAGLFQAQKLSGGHSQRVEPVKLGEPCKKDKLAASVSDKKRGKQPMSQNELDDQKDPGLFVDIDLTNEEEKENDDEEAELADEWLCAEIEKIVDGKGHANIRKDSRVPR